MTTVFRNTFRVHEKYWFTLTTGYRYVLIIAMHVSFCNELDMLYKKLQKLCFLPKNSMMCIIVLLDVSLHFCCFCALWYILYVPQQHTRRKVLAFYCSDSKSELWNNNFETRMVKIDFSCRPLFFCVRKMVSRNSSFLFISLEVSNQ